MTQDKIIDKLGKIKAHMESAKEIGNEAEAQAFAAMLQNLLAKHKLEMTDIDYTKHLQEEPVEQYEAGGGIARDAKGKFVLRNYPDVEMRRCRVAWIEALAKVIATAHSCDILVAKGTSRIWFVGRKSDAQVAEYLFVTMLRAAERLADKEYVRYFYLCRDRGDVTRARGFRPSFLQGFVVRLNQRFEEEKRKLERDYTGTALMRINKEALAVRKYIENLEGKPAHALGENRNFNREGYARGKAVADGLNLNANAMREGQPNKQLK